MAPPSSPKPLAGFGAEARRRANPARQPPADFAAGRLSMLAGGTTPRTPRVRHSPLPVLSAALHPQRRLWLTPFRGSVGKVLAFAFGDQGRAVVLAVGPGAPVAVQV